MSLWIHTTRHVVVRVWRYVTTRGTKNVALLQAISSAFRPTGKSQSLRLAKLTLLLYLTLWYYVIMLLAVSSPAALRISLSARGTQSGTLTGGAIRPRLALTWRSRNSVSLSTKAPVGLSIASILLWPAPSTQKGFARHGWDMARNSCSPCQKGTTSSCVPWITKLGHLIFGA